jgi:hypothetical protein
MLWSHWKAPMDRLLFLILCSIALTNGESFSNRLWNRNMQWELLILHLRKIFLVVFWNFWMQTKCYSNFKIHSYLSNDPAKFPFFFIKKYKTPTLHWEKYRRSMNMFSNPCVRIHGLTRMSVLININGVVGKWKHSDIANESQYVQIFWAKTHWSI